MTPANSVNRLASEKKHAALYVIGTGCVLLLKIVLTAATVSMGVTIWVAYLFTQLVVVIASYVYHSLISFRKPLNRATLRKYVLATLLIKIIDYFIVSLAVYVHILGTTPAIIASAILIYIVRYISVRRVLLNEKDAL